MEKYGFGLSRKKVLLVGKYVNKNRIATPLTNGIPSTDWLFSFMKRDKLSVKKPENVEIARRKNSDPFVISGYFQCATPLGIQEKPHFMWNLDDTSFCKDPSKTEVVRAVGVQFAAKEEPTPAMFTTAMPTGLTPDNGPSVSFKELLLASVKCPSVSTDEKLTRKRICEGAKMITGEEIVERMKLPQKQKIRRTCNRCGGVATDEELQQLLEREIQEMDEANDFPTTAMKKKVGDWAILSEDRKAIVRFVRKASETKTVTTFNYPGIDESEIVNDDIISVLPQPVLGRR
ncbi:hypothetical protein PR048_025557 [Dryococelus australis]|uniref:Uncharacterized protein n=1 Tax=Dryococelus australis TaxID=614101 RepID=A0ABQ9GRN5_9NEOP|nr:hypothetical protein PR048_025557 [Dryococelus australis]